MPITDFSHLWSGHLASEAQSSPRGYSPLHLGIFSSSSQHTVHSEYFWKGSEAPQIRGLHLILWLPNSRAAAGWFGPPGCCNLHCAAQAFSTNIWEMLDHREIPVMPTFLSHSPYIQGDCTPSGDSLNTGSGWLSWLYSPFLLTEWHKWGLIWTENLTQTLDEEEMGPLCLLTSRSIQYLLYSPWPKCMS